MKRTRRETIEHFLNVIAIFLIIEAFLCSMMLVRRYAREDCFTKIEESTAQAATMFKRAIDQSQGRLELFADILAANNSNPDEQLKVYMENFIKTHYFTAVCVHRADGSVVSQGAYPHDLIAQGSFEQEASQLPYTSRIFSYGDLPEQKCFYQAVPVIRNGEIVGILHGYIYLDVLPKMVTSTAYGGASKLYIVDGDTGNFLMSSQTETLTTIYDDSLGILESRDDFEIEKMYDDVQKGESGYFAFRSMDTNQWYYAYYMPIGINNWSMQMTVDENTAFDTYNSVTLLMVILAVVVVGLMVLHILVLMSQTSRINQKDKKRLARSQYINKVQSTLLYAHHNPEYLERALKTIAQENRAESALLLAFSDRIVQQAYFWPSADRLSVAELLNRNVRNDFPVIYDQLVEDKSVIWDEKSEIPLSQPAVDVFRKLAVNNIIITPILNTAGQLRGVICAVNIEGEKEPELLECLTYDMFMTITNMENQAIIRHMGMMDYLTNVKNRNCYEKEIREFASISAQSLWCVFVDVNGLHEINNTRGHKAGDLMLCDVAEAVQQFFGSEYTYRLGGDEFVSFSLDNSLEKLQQRKEEITQYLAAKDYYVSVGFSGVEKSENGLFNVEQVVSEAETTMYQDKWEYYQRNGIPSERGHFPQVGKQTQAQGS